jgi:hypothetical protein
VRVCTGVCMAACKCLHCMARATPAPHTGSRLTHCAHSPHPVHARASHAQRAPTRAPQTVQYIQPHHAAGRLGQAELLVIDEAAAIPLTLVKAMLGPYLVFLCSTGACCVCVVCVCARAVCVCVAGMYARTSGDERDLHICVLQLQRLHRRRR